MLIGQWKICRAVQVKSEARPFHNYINLEHTHTVVFREMVEKHPEALHEMKDVMTNIGQKWESNQYSGRTPTAQLNNPEPVYDQDVYPSSESDSSLTEPIYASHQAHHTPPVPPYASHQAHHPPPIPPHQKRSRSHYAHRRRSGRNGQGYVCSAIIECVFYMLFFEGMLNCLMWISLNYSTGNIDTNFLLAN